ncbi:MAG: prepilin-type N-terminal cleavage/methylation domain-containing protein [Longimicrobiales bacterium]
MRNRIRATARAGFTLIEVLVTLVLLALLIGVIVPQVINQLDRGDPTRVAADLEAMRSGAKMFRVDVKRLPGYAHQLALDPVNWDVSTGVDDSASINTTGKTTIPDNLVDRWAGPYLEGAEMEGVDPDSMLIAFGYKVDDSFVSSYWSGSSGTQWVTANVYGPEEADVEEISEVVDGNTDTTTGRARWDTDHMQYFIVPIN